MSLASFLDGGLAAFGGAAVIISIMSTVSAYNHYLLRKYAREIRDAILVKKEERK